MSDYFDVIIVGAGISGISAAYHVQKYCPQKSYAVLEGRAALGGTWDLFRYPGVRSDSDMHTLGFHFKPWTAAESIADGPAILDYLQETVDEFGIAPHIQFNQRVTALDWDSPSARWAVSIETDGVTRTLHCAFLIMGTGYYSYTQPHQPDFPNQSAFKGQIIHPQFWPEALDYHDKRVIVIGSGATAATLVPALAQNAAHVTMLQRSPTFMVPRPRRDRFANTLRRLLPGGLAYAITRWKNIRMQWFEFSVAQKYPQFVAKNIIGEAVKALGPDYDVRTHFTPSYGPWDQRVCLVPEGDLFSAISSGKAEVITNNIACFTEEGIMLEDESVVPADIIVTATGLTMEVMSGVTLTIDGEQLPLRRTIIYKGCMYSGVPNLVGIVGYSNASWTLKADLISRFAARLINYMARKKVDMVVPRADGVLPLGTPLLNLNSGYIERAALRLPKQGDKDPWRIHHNVFKDRQLIGRARFDDGALHFSRAP